MDKNTKMLLENKQYDEVIVPYNRLFIKNPVLKSTAKEEITELFEYMLTYDPHSKYTLLAADNLYRFSLDFGNVKEAERTGKYILKALNEQIGFCDNPSIYHPENDHLNFYFKYSTRFKDYASFISDFPTSIQFVKEFSSEGVLTEIFNLAKACFLSGNYYIAGALSECLRNHYIDLWWERKNFEFAIPIYYASILMISAIIALNIDFRCKTLMLFPKVYYSKDFRFLGSLMMIYAEFAVGKRRKAQKHLGMLRKAKLSYRDFSLVYFLRQISSIISPLNYPLCFKFSPDGKDCEILRDRYYLSLAREFLLDGDACAALETIERIRISEPCYKNALFFNLSAEYWALKADIYDLSEQYSEQYKAINEWVKYSTRAEQFEVKASRSLHKMFEDKISGITQSDRPIFSF